MIIYDDNIKDILYLKIIWFFWLIICNIYSTIIISINSRVLYFVILTVILNIISLLFTSVDIYIMVKNNKRSDDIWVSGSVYGFSFIITIILISYFISVGVNYYPVIIYEFIMMIIYAISYPIIVITWFIFFCSTRLYDNTNEETSLVN